MGSALCNNAIFCTIYKLSNEHLGTFIIQCIVVIGLQEKTFREVGINLTDVHKIARQYKFFNLSVINFPKYVHDDGWRGGTKWRQTGGRVITTSLLLMYQLKI